MASTICGWCGDRTHMGVKVDPFLLPADGNWHTYMSAFQCANERCRRLSIGWIRRPTKYTNPQAEVPQADLKWEPISIRRPEFPDVPQQIAESASEAHACMSIQAYRGAVALARAVVEATAKDKGITSGSLAQKIDRLHEQGHIRPITREVAHEIRHGGNEIAHGDLGDEPMPAEDAEAILRLMDEILQEVYQGPAAMLKLKQSRIEREQRNSSSA